jgi:uncharacterized membrane protein (Fun14 family)
MSQPADNPAPPPPGRPTNFGSIVARFVRDVTYMPRWHKGVLSASALALILGWIHWGVHTLGATTQPTPSALGEWSRRVGASVIIGFVIGWIFRTFLKLMALVTGLVLSAIVLLSYFNFTNIDLTKAEKQYKDSSSWVTDQAGKLKDGAMSHVHSTLGGVLGAFMGVRKKKPAA